MTIKYFKSLKWLKLLFGQLLDRLIPRHVIKLFFAKKVFIVGRTTKVNRLGKKRKNKYVFCGGKTTPNHCLIRSPLSNVFLWHNEKCAFSKEESLYFYQRKICWHFVRFFFLTPFFFFEGGPFTSRKRRKMIFKS